eukprot:TRINITY_DN15134_c0_g1_i4.p1 TRINITY_DN15134_c0_g1~~TRINITY_DN15134_c0_g1_i4.p1  ORF type:complete len:106 (+),score=15.88 TRINITY_DN15134_c0_g1_i4:106-423(+)
MTEVWIIGSIVFYMLHGKAALESVYRENLENYEYPIREDLTDSCKDFLQRCLVYQRTKRLSYEEMKRHLFILNQQFVEDSKGTLKELKVKVGEEVKFIEGECTFN